MYDRRPSVLRASPDRAHFPGTILLVLLLGLAQAMAASARSLRVATYNVEHGIGEAGTEKGDAQRAILRRVDADIVGFQELNRRTREEWIRLADELGYEHFAWGEMGPFAGGMVVGYFSRYPIIESQAIRCPEGAREFSRFPLRITVDIPGAARPLTLWNMHHKALFRPVDDFRRAVEAFRIVRDIERTAAAHPDRAELIVLGDMNDDAARCRDPERAPQSDAFEAPPEGLPRTYAVGPGLPFPLRYRSFPLDVYRAAGPGFRAVNATREGTESFISHVHTQYRLDYIFVSRALWDHPQGPPAGEVYPSDWETGGGLRKAGDRPNRGATQAASDHYVVFADIRLEPTPAPEAGPE